MSEKSQDSAADVPRIDQVGGDSARPTEPDKTALTVRLPKIIPFCTLARCGDEVWIENDGQLYRLRRTRQGKLILTK